VWGEQSAQLSPSVPCNCEICAPTWWVAGWLLTSTPTARPAPAQSKAAATLDCTQGGKGDSFPPDVYSAMLLTGPARRVACVSPTKDLSCVRACAQHVNAVCRSLAGRLLVGPKRYTRRAAPLPVHTVSCARQAENNSSGHQFWVQPHACQLVPCPQQLAHHPCSPPFSMAHVPQPKDIAYAGRPASRWGSGLFDCFSDLCVSLARPGAKLLRTCASVAAADACCHCCACSSTCCYGFWCLPILYGENTNQIHGGGCFGHCCLYYCCTPFACFFAGGNRTDMRNMHG
jgi:hypothetical protein